jgi:hypothetical protein
MSTTATSTAVERYRPVMSEVEQTTLLGFLAGYRGYTRDAYTLDLRQFTAWCWRHHRRTRRIRHRQAPVGDAPQRAIGIWSTTVLIREMAACRPIHASRRERGTAVLRTSKVPERPLRRESDSAQGHTVEALCQRRRRGRTGPHARAVTRTEPQRLTTAPNDRSTRDRGRSERHFLASATMREPDARPIEQQRTSGVAFRRDQHSATHATRCCAECTHRV